MIVFYSYRLVELLLFLIFPIQVLHTYSSPMINTYNSNTISEMSVRILNVYNSDCFYETNRRE